MLEFSFTAYRRMSAVSSNDTLVVILLVCAALLQSVNQTFSFQTGMNEVSENGQGMLGCWDGQC